MIDRCVRRGAYVYQRAAMTLRYCRVTGTVDPTRAAIEAAGCREGDAVTLRVQLAVGETVILLHPPLPLVGVSMETMGEHQ